MVLFFCMNDADDPDPIPTATVATVAASVASDAVRGIFFIHPT